MCASGESALDFVIPLCNYNIIIRVTIESIVLNYNPKNIYIVTNKNDVEVLEKDCLQWNLFNTKIIVLNEDMFFFSNYGLTKSYIYNLYTWKDEESREFGWWYQQLLKIGAFKQIKNLSDPYVVWDSDLIALQKWNLYDEKTNTYKFAILQESAKNEFNKTEYGNSIRQLIGVEAIEPPMEGTFVPHHFIMHHKVLQGLITHIENNNKTEVNWIKTIMLLSNTYYRFSEYKCIASFMNSYYPELLLFYPFQEYGKSGIRYRESDEMVEQLIFYCKNKTDNLDDMSLTYNLFQDFVRENYDETPSYIQLEHVQPSTFRINL
jgi:hypothetical protein